MPGPEAVKRYKRAWLFRYRLYLSFEEIGKRFGVGESRARQLVKAGEEIMFVEKQLRILSHEK